MRKIKRARIDFLSLVPRGANRQPVLYKAETHTVEFQTLTKAGENFDEKGELLALAYVPDLVDAQGDFATREAVEGMAHSFIKEGAKLDLRHNEKPIAKDRAYVAENFIVQKGDTRFQGWKDYEGKPIDPTGSWAVLLKIEDKELRKLYRDGAWNGVSFGSRDFEVEIVKEDPVSITLEQLQKALADQKGEILKAVDEKIAAKAPTPPAPPADDKLVFKGDVTKIEDIRKHAEALRRQALLKSVDLSDPDAVETLLKRLEAEEESKKKNETPEQRIARIEKENATLKLRLEKQQATSNVPPADAPPPAPTPEGLSKEEADGAKIGRRIAEIANKSRGYKAAK